LLKTQKLLIIWQFWLNCNYFLYKLKNIGIFNF